MSIPCSICTEIQKAGDIRRNQSRCRKDTKTAMPAKRDRNNRSGVVQRPCAYVNQHTAEIQRIPDNGISKGEKQSNDI